MRLSSLAIVVAGSEGERRRSRRVGVSPHGILRKPKWEDGFKKTFTAFTARLSDPWDDQNRITFGRQVIILRQGSN